MCRCRYIVFRVTTGITRKTEYAPIFGGRGARALQQLQSLTEGREIVLNLFLLLLRRYVPAQDPIEQALTPQCRSEGKGERGREIERKREKASGKDREREKKYEKKRVKREGETGEVGRKGKETINNTERRRKR